MMQKEPAVDWHQVFTGRNWVKCKSAKIQNGHCLNTSKNHNFWRNRSFTSYVYFSSKRLRSQNWTFAAKYAPFCILVIKPEGQSLLAETCILSLTKYKMIKKYLCTWWIQKVTRSVKMFPPPVSRLLLTRWPVFGIARPTFRMYSVMVTFKSSW
jgi:hypothetical protein